MGKIDDRLAELGIGDLEGFAPKAGGNYVPFVITGKTVYISGQISQEAGTLKTGRVGDEIGLEEAAASARLCALSLIGVLKAAAGGDLDRVARVIKLTGFVNSAPDFTDQPKVINGASNLMVDVFGEAGSHARSAVGVAALPLGVQVEIEGIFELT
ncbi:MAG: RidA family protein [Pseudomonadota bacterium]